VNAGALPALTLRSITGAAARQPRSNA